MANTGNIIVVERDTNPNSSSYNTTRVRYYTDLTRCPTSSVPDWSEISYVCEQIGGVNTGNVIATERDVNPASASYGTTRTRTYEDLTRCPTSTDPAWVEQTRTCQIDSNGNDTGYVYYTETDMNPASATYGQSRAKNEFNFVKCHHLANGVKEYISSIVMPPQYQSNQPRSLACNGNATLAKTERLSIAERFYAVVGDCVTAIGGNCYKDDGAITYVFLPDTITSIADGAFENCACLRYVYVYATTPPFCDVNAFHNSQGNLTIYVPAASVEAYRSAGGWPSSRIQAMP